MYVLLGNRCKLHFNCLSLRMSNINFNYFTDYHIAQVSDICIYVINIKNSDVFIK